MALIKCPECKKKISDQCGNCPHCGYPVQDYIQQQNTDTSAEVSEQPKKAGKKTGLIIGIAVAVVTIAVAAIILWSQGVFTPAPPLPFSEDTAAIEAADASVVKVFCYDYDGDLAATGSGFIVYDSKTVVTNYHVMTSAYTCKISTNLDVSYEVANVLCFSKEIDLAFLQLAQDTELQPLTFGNSADIKKGETVVAIGSPLGIKNTVSTGILSGRPMEDNMEVLQFTAPISSGSSGGALFDNNGKVIGITYASYDAGQNLNLAIPAEKASDLYETRQGPKKVSVIYGKEHPHIAWLDSYKDAPIVTLADLKRNPEKYDDKIIRMSIYVSSWGKESKYSWQQGNWYLSEKNYISLNNEYDIAVNAENSFQKSPLIECYTDYDRSRYVDDSVKPGDLIEIVAYFDFHKAGEHLFSGSESTWDYDGANLEAILIWK